MEDPIKTKILVSGGKFIGGVMLIWCALVLYLIRPVHAATLPAVPKTPSALASTIQSLYYAAQFDWEVSPNQLRPMEIRVGSGTGTDFVAEIWSGRQLQAHCGLMNFSKEGPNVPVALEMECRGAKLDGLVSHATLLWPQGAFQNPTLQFGTWLQGYSRKAVLRVRVDRYSKPGNFRGSPVATRKVARRT